MAGTKSPKQQAAMRSKVKASTKKVAATRRKAVEDAKNLEVTDVEAWKKESGLTATKVKLPSGKVCLATNPGIEPFLTEGLVPNSLLQIVDRLVTEGKGMTVEETRKMQTDSTQMADSIRLANAVLIKCVVKPEVHPSPEKESDREPGRLYADEVDIDDKMFIFQWVVGGTRDLERFREQQSAALAGLVAVEDVPAETE